MKCSLFILLGYSKQIHELHEVGLLHAFLHVVFGESGALLPGTVIPVAAAHNAQLGG